MVISGLPYCMEELLLKPVPEELAEKLSEEFLFES